MNINFYRLNKTNSYVIFQITQKISDNNSFLNSCANLIKDTDIFHLKNSALTTKELIEIIKPLKLICAEFNTILILEDRCDIVLSTDIDGVFLNKDSFSYQDARHILGENKIIGAELQNNNADYFVTLNNNEYLKGKIYFIQDEIKLSQLNNVAFLCRAYQ